MEPLLGSDPSSLGDYELLGRLGSGGFGVVYAATGSGGQKVAIKLLRPELSDDQTLRDRLAREGEALGRVGGQRNVKIHDVVTEGEFAYLVMDLVEGETLSARVTENGPLTGPLLWFAAQGLVEALEDIHQAGIIHRDLKPSNVMYGPDGIKVLDFGISAVTDESALTQTGAFLATAAWISPEQVLGREVNEQSDVFNLGMVLAFAATGEHPFGTGRADAVMYRITNTEPELEGVPQPLRDAVEMCLQTDPLQRPSMETLKGFFASTGASELETTNQEAGTVIVQPGRLVSAATSIEDTGTSTKTNPKKKKWVIPAASVAAALVIGMLAFQGLQNNEPFALSEISETLDQSNVDLNTDQLSFEVESTTTFGTPTATKPATTTTDTPATTDPVTATTITTESPTTTSLPADPSSQTEDILAAVYLWGPSEETTALQQVLGQEADGFYGETTRNAHINELTARNMTTINVPNPPEISTTTPVVSPTTTVAVNCSVISFSNVITESVWIAGNGTYPMQVTISSDCPVGQVSVFYRDAFGDGCPGSTATWLASGSRSNGVWETATEVHGHCAQGNLTVTLTAYSMFQDDPGDPDDVPTSIGSYSFTVLAVTDNPEPPPTTVPCDQVMTIPNMVGLLTWEVANLDWPASVGCSPFIWYDFQVQPNGDTIIGFVDCDSGEPPIISQSMVAGSTYTIRELGSLSIETFRQTCSS
jgi:serine/threonine protein kinase